MNESRLRRLRDKAPGAATLINEGCKIVGTISGSGSYLVNGEVDGDCEVAGTVTLAENGFWRGTIHAENVIVAGRVDGDIIAGGKVELEDGVKEGIAVLQFDGGAWSCVSAASGGLRLACARSLAAEGVSVTLNARFAEAL